MPRIDYKSRRSYAVCSPRTLWSLTRLRYFLSYNLCILFNTDDLFSRNLSSLPLNQYELLTSTSLSKKVYSLATPHEKKKSPFVCFALASSQFPWYHLAATLEETAKSQSLFLFSWHSSPNRPLPNVIKTFILSISLASDFCLHSLPALHSSLPMSPWGRGFHSLAASLSVSETPLVPFCSLS